MSEKKCYICSGKINFFGNKYGYSYFTCEICQSTQLYPLPTSKFLEEKYRDLYASANQTEEISHPEYWKRAGKPYHQDIVTLVKKYSSEFDNPNVVDYGGGWGHLCKLMIDNSIKNVSGIEASLEMVEYAKKKEIPMIQGGFEELKNCKSFSILTMCAVFEHLTDHNKWLKEINKLLPVGGYFITLHPTSRIYNFLGDILRLGKKEKELPELHGTFYPPWHTILFSLKGMQMLASKFGFEIIEVVPASQGQLNGFIGVIQKLLGIVNKLGFLFFKLKWPLITTHIFVLKKNADI